MTATGNLGVKEVWYPLGSQKVHSGSFRGTFKGILERSSLYCNKTLATRTAIHASVFTVIVADASAKHTTRMLYGRPWPTEAF